MASIVERWKERAKQLKTEIFSLYLAYRDPRTPWYARLFTALVVGYAFSPIDLIPDFIPVLGYLDDLVIVPLGVFLALRLIPPQVMQESREKAKIMVTDGKPVNKVAAILIILSWIVVLVLIGIAGYRLLKR